MKQLHNNLSAIHGAEVAQAWFDQLPQLLAHYAHQWQLNLIGPLEQMSYHYLHQVTYQDQNAVLKLGGLNPDFYEEVDTLHAFQGPQVVGILQSTPEALLLKALQPAQQLGQLSEDEKATQYAAEVMLQMQKNLSPHHPLPDVPTLLKWSQGFERLRTRHQGQTGPLPRAWVERAEHYFNDLSQGGEPTLLHGDLHQGNILYDQESGWTMIDPHGVIGDLAFEPSAFLRNHLVGQSNPPHILSQRIAIFSEVLALDAQRIWAWGFAQSVLSLAWCDEDNMDAGKAYDVPQIYLDIEPEL